MAKIRVVTIAWLVVTTLGVASCGKSGPAKSSSSTKPIAQTAASETPAATKPAGDPAAYSHAVDCMAATMSQRPLVEATLKSMGSTMNPFTIGPTWARRMHELAKPSGHTDNDAETDGMNRLGEASKAATAGKPLFDENFVTACVKDMPQY